jgi:aspartyl-tRNA(Asn)/glutamyl-tRNA(Gln) amidotransferase subunit A
MSETPAKSRMSHVADYADLTATEEQLAASYGVVESLISVLRAAPNNALDAVEPSTSFKLPVPDATSQPVSPAPPAPGAGAAPSDLTYLSVAEAAAYIQNKELSPVELTQAVLNRIEQLNPTLQAYVTVIADQALEAARKAEKEISAGQLRGNLHGIPLALKDLVETKNILTTASSKVLADYVPNEDASVAKKLQEAGAILLGKTHTHEFAYGVICPPTRNPWNTDCIPGGSSGGSAAAVASGMAQMAIGTDTGGSIRIPSALCGTTGIKPTYGRVSRKGVISLSWSLDHVGPICRSAEDAAFMLQAIAGYDQADPASAIAPTGDYLSGLKNGIKGLRIGIASRPYFQLATPGVTSAVQAAAKTLSDLGAELVEVQVPNIEEATPIVFTIVMAEASAYHQKWLRNKGELYNPDTFTLLQGGELVLATDYLQAQRRRSVYTEGVLKLYDQIDVLLLPTEPCPAPRVDDAVVKIGEVELPPIMALIYYTAPFNGCGLPALALPCGFEQGLPLSLQLVGRPFEEATLLRAGYAFQQATDWHKQHPMA